MFFVRVVGIGVLPDDFFDVEFVNGLFGSGFGEKGLGGE